MAHICFVTEEIAPITPGGAGTLIHNSMRALQSRGHRLSLLLDVEESVFREALKYFENQPIQFFSVAQLTKAVIPSEQEKPDFDELLYERSYRTYLALRQLETQGQSINFVEFNDFYGMAYYALAAKASGLAFSKTQLGIRFHNTWEYLMSGGGDGIAMNSYALSVRYLERAALRLAEQLLSPSAEYTNRVYLPHYGQGLGEIHTSKPALLRWPHERSISSNDTAKIILFYGRLQPMKGLDRLLPALLEFAEEKEDATFYFVGPDSIFSQDQFTASYSAFFKKRIPKELQARFKFTGKLEFSELSQLLPNVRFAIFPNYIESFCYAAQELYQAGIPLIISKMPALESTFIHEKNALVFDGSVSDLLQQIRRLYEDHTLCSRLQKPFSIADISLGSFYESLPSRSWIHAHSDKKTKISLLIALIHTGFHELKQTLDSITSQLEADDRIVILEETEKESDVAPLLFLGKGYRCVEPDGRTFKPSNILTKDALLILSAGDRLMPSTLHSWRKILERQPEISFVSSWCQRGDSRQQASIDALPFEICLDQLLFTPRSLLQRALMRTKRGQRLDDLFDLRLGCLGELDYLWNLDQSHGPGLTICELLIDCAEENSIIFCDAFPSLVSYLVSKDTSELRQKSLAMRSLIHSRQLLSAQELANILVQKGLNKLKKITGR
jgi:glycosyltransferase involved in cell wall biosynthesis